MNIQVTGVLVDSMNQVSADTIIRTEALDSVGTFKGSIASITTEADGSYDFEMVYGTHSIEVKFSDEYVISGVVLVDEDTTTPLSVIELLVNYETIAPEDYIPKGEKGDKGDQGEQGEQGDAGTGINLLGIKPLAEILVLEAETVGDSYVSSTSGSDSQGNTVKAEDMLRAIDVLNPSTWVNIGPLVGPEGEQGLQGEKGDKGDTGEKGDQGDRGLQGIEGVQGQRGLKGDTGEDGLDSVVPGPQGVQGETGETGLTGATGEKGDTGDRGPIGDQGIQGIQGLVGDKGETGATGAQGLEGEKGEKGDTGDTGATGLQGERGGMAQKSGYLTGEAPVISIDPGDTTYSIIGGATFIYYNYEDRLDIKTEEKVFAGVVGNPINITPPAVIKYIYLNTQDMLIEESSSVPAVKANSWVYLGNITSDGIIVSAANLIETSYVAADTQNSLLLSHGDFNLAGCDYYGAGGLTLGHTEGYGLRIGANTVTDPNDPDRVYTSQDEIQYVVWAHTNVLGELVVTTSPDSIDPTMYVNDGVLTAVTSSKWTVQYLYHFYGSNTVLVYYGNKQHADEDTATNALVSPPLDIHSVTKEAVFRTAIVVRGGATDLTDPLDAIMYNV